MAFEASEKESVDDWLALPFSATFGRGYAKRKENTHPKGPNMLWLEGRESVQPQILGITCKNLLWTTPQQKKRKHNSSYTVCSLCNQVSQSLTTGLKVGCSTERVLAASCPVTLEVMLETASHCRGLYKPSKTSPTSSDLPWAPSSTPNACRRQTAFETTPSFLLITWLPGQLISYCPQENAAGPS